MLPKIKKVGSADHLAVTEGELGELRALVAPGQSSGFSVEGLLDASGSYLERSTISVVFRAKRRSGESVSEFALRFERERVPGSRSFENEIKVAKTMKRLSAWVSLLRGRSYTSLGLLAKDIRDALESARTTPLGTEQGWLYQGFIYEADGPYSEDESRLLVLEHFDRERLLFERLRRKHSTDDPPAERVRTRIPSSPHRSVEA